jgi:release factor glutamine methyltransferase
MRVRLLKHLTPVIQPLYRRYVSTTRSFRYGDLRIHVHPGVFYPGFILSTGIFLRHLDSFDLAGKKLLEIGAGSGIISLLAASKGAIVTSTDISPTAINNIHENTQKNKLNLTVIESDLFKKVPNILFDYIIITPPYYPKDPVGFPEMAWYCGNNFEYFEKLFQQLPEFYHDSCTVLMILSEDCNISWIMELAAVHGFKFTLSLQKKRLGEWNYIFRICKSTNEASNN